MLLKKQRRRLVNVRPPFRILEEDRGWVRRKARREAGRLDRAGELTYACLLSLGRRRQGQEVRINGYSVGRVWSWLRESAEVGALDGAGSPKGMGIKPRPSLMRNAMTLCCVSLGRVGEMAMWGAESRRRQQLSVGRGRTCGAAAASMLIPGRCRCAPYLSPCSSAVLRVNLSGSAIRSSWSALLAKALDGLLEPDWA